MCIAHNCPTHTQYGISLLHVILSSEMWVELLLKKRLKNEFSTNWIQYIVYISQIAQRVIGFFSALLFNQYNVYAYTQTQTHLLLCNFVYWFFLILIFTSCVSLFLIHSLTVSHEYTTQPIYDYIFIFCSYQLLSERSCCSEKLKTSRRRRGWWTKVL